MSFVTKLPKLSLRLIKIGFILLTIGIVFYLLTLLWLLTQMYPSKTVSADVILVPGAAVYVHHQYNPCLLGRVNESVKLYQSKAAPKIIMSGGTDTGTDNNEAKSMADLAVKQGVPLSDIILEPNSTSTYENLSYSQKIMKENNLQSAVIVAEPFHIPRVKLVAHKLGLSYEIASASTPCWTRWGVLSRAYLREPFALVKYFFDGKI